MDQDPDCGLLSSGVTAQKIQAAIVYAHCEALGLHTLGSTDSTMPKEDPCLPSVRCPFRRQVGLRVWQDYLSMEVQIGIVLSSKWTSEQPIICKSLFQITCLLVKSYSSASRELSPDVQL